MTARRRSSRFDPHETVWADRWQGAALAPFGRRATAFLLDMAVALLLSSGVSLAFGALARSRHPHDRDIAINFHDPWSLLWIVIYVGGASWWWDGRTPGKRLLRLRVVSLVGPRITLWQGVERALGYGASALEGGFGFAQIFIARNRQCVHDRIAETIVIHDRPAPAGPALTDPVDQA